MDSDQVEEFDAVDDSELGALALFGALESLICLPTSFDRWNRHVRQKGFALKERVVRTVSVDKEFERVRSRFDSHLEKLKDKWHDGKVLQTREKIAFALGVSNVFLSAYLLGALPEKLHIWHWKLKTSKTHIKVYFTVGVFFSPQMDGLPPQGMYAFLCLIFPEEPDHYFLMDLCYHVNMMLVAFLWFFPDSRPLFISVYCLSTGSLAFAILAWRNSLVFHSLDKVTSLFIHIYPPLILHTIRHILPPAASHERFPALQKTPRLELLSALKHATVAYVIWQSVYYLFINIRRRDKILAGRPTSFTWLRKSYAKTRIGRFTLRFPEPIQVVLFMAIQYLYAMITMIPCPIWYSYRLWSGCFLLFVFGWSVWNGANYYVDVFGRRFQKELEALQEEIGGWNAGGK